MIVVHEEVHPEVHFSSTSTLSEAAPYGRPLSVVEEQSTTADRTVPCGTGEAAFESAAEQAACWQQQDVQNPTEEPEGAVAPEGEGYRPTGLSQPLVRRKATYSEDTPEGRLLAAIREEGAVSSKSRLDQLMGISWVEVNEVIPRMAEEGIVWHDREHGVLLLN